MIEARHFIENHGWYDECSLNKKLLRLPLDCFTEICDFEDSYKDVFTPEIKKEITSIAKTDSQICSFLKDFTKDGLKSLLMNASKEIILSVISILPFGGVAKTAFDLFAKIISGGKS